MKKPLSATRCNVSDPETFFPDPGSSGMNPNYREGMKKMTCPDEKLL